MPLSYSLVKQLTHFFQFTITWKSWGENSHMWASLTVVCCSFSWVTMVGSSLLLAMRSLNTCSLYLVMMSSNADWCSSNDVRSSAGRVNTDLVCVGDNTAKKPLQEHLSAPCGFAVISNHTSLSLPNCHVVYKSGPQISHPKIRIKQLQMNRLPLFSCWSSLIWRFSCWIPRTRLERGRCRATWFNESISSWYCKQEITKTTPLTKSKYTPP